MALAADHYYEWVLARGIDHCPSCLVLAGQVHPGSVWTLWGIEPGYTGLLCKGGCHCHFEDIGEVEADGPALRESGSMDWLPLRSNATPDGMPFPDEPDVVEDEDDGENAAVDPGVYIEPGVGGKSSGSKAMEQRRDEGGRMADEIRVKLAAPAAVTPAGEFEVMAITAGDGNGWNFGANVLRESLALWDGVDCFMDHALENHSVRDLAGVCYDPGWDVAGEGVRLKLRAVGPSGGLLTELGRAMLSVEGPKPDVGFSADVIFTADGQKVEKILRVLSLDLVYNPARGGEFIRALNQRKDAMTEEKAKYEDGGLEKERAAVRVLLDEQTRLQAAKDELDKAKLVRAEMCGYLLETGLGASRLPAPAAERVRKQFKGKVFEASELQAAIDDARELVSQLTGGMTVQGPRIGGMVVTEEKLQAAVDDLLGAPREKSMTGVHVDRLSGIRELYMMLTGDYDLHGGYRAERVRLATTTDFSGLVKNALNKMVVNQWDILGRAGYDWWQSIATVEHFGSLNGITGTLIGTVGDLPTVAEGAEYTELAVGDSPETASFVKYGGYIPLTLELIDRDETRKLAAYPRELASASIRKISSLVAALFSASSGAGPTMADTGALFNATAVTTKGGHKNLLTTALSTTQWETVSNAVYDQPLLIRQDTGYYGTGPKMAVNPRYCLVPRALALTAKNILYPDHAAIATYNYENQQKGVQGDVVVVPDWTDLTDWAAACDPSIAPAVYVGERFGLTPEIYISGDELSPAVFTNDEHRLKIRHFLAVWVNDFRPLANNHVA